MGYYAIKSAVADLPRLGLNQWQRIHCPVCLDRTGKGDRRGSFDWNSSTGGYVCHKCGITGRVSGYAPDPEADFDVGAPPRVETRALVQLPEVPLPEDFTALWAGPGAESPEWERARAYAATRCRPELWQLLGLGATGPGFTVEASRIIVPIYDAARRCLGWVGRSYRAESWRPYHYPHMDRKGLLYNDAVLDIATTQPCFVVEGVFDVAHIYPNAVACLGKPSRAQMQRLARAKRPVVYLLDGDAITDGEDDVLMTHCMAEAPHPNWACVLVPLPPKTDPDEFPVPQLEAWAHAALQNACM
jgi:hypothetical protein